MKQDDFEEFCDLISLVAEQYQKPVSDGAMMLYFQGLIDYDFEAVKQALFRHIRNPDNGMFMPKIADIVKMMQGSTKDAALIAWTKVDWAVRCVGTQSSVVFDDEVIHAVINDMGGWHGFGKCDLEKDWPFKAKEFENRYRAYKQRSEPIKHVPKLIGMYESENSQQGFKIEQPTMIGDKEKAKQVFLTGTNSSNIMLSRPEDRNIDDIKILIENKPSNNNE